ncbi:Aste57867_13371 [Aphanomyces stellatus]|uniref:Aste57867_13371 protein n=1 Tax=Aphanomyces stellatus TaxID=120398 RepID=A0A485KYU2_9STRA|nr:hypothetical protein As57867_013321 [Aphanomyces stellatus]VFT90210.1 Aste57867_13371 [Aphanomyces stellatus]
MSKSARNGGASFQHRDDVDAAISKYKKAAAAAAASASSSEDTIVIHVCDEFRKVNKDFVCNKTLLLDNMKYFKAYLNDASAHEDIDISVHCDVSIFDWLFRYIHRQGKSAAVDVDSDDSVLAIDNVTSILISSDFLQMDFLVAECTVFISTHLEQVVDMPGDLLCISDAILDKIAAMCSFEQLDAIEATKDKLCYKLYSKRLHRMLAALKDMDGSGGGGIDACVHCDIVHYAGHRAFLACRKAPLSIGHHGQVLAAHEPKSEWKVETWVKALMVSGSARQAFWTVWGALQCLYCYDCRTYVTATELNECRYHVSTRGDDGVYACCGTARFAADTRASSGCKVKQHACDPAVFETLANAHGLNAKRFEMPELLDRVFQLVLGHADVLVRAPPHEDAVPPSTTMSGKGALHEMLAPHVKPQISMLATCDVPNDLMKTMRSSQHDESTPQSRKQWKIDLLQEKDRIRVQMLSSALTKMRVEYKVANRQAA